MLDPEEFGLLAEAQAQAASWCGGTGMAGGRQEAVQEWSLSCQSTSGE